MGVKGYVMQLQPFSVNDGDGIRTTIFMAGCPLRCKWCCNPEGFTAEEKRNVKTGEKMVTLMDADDVLKQIQKHRLFYSYSGGGITFSGGEATQQIEFLDYLTEHIYDMGYSMALETSCMFDWDRTEHVLRRMDLIFADIKMMDPKRHLKWTGVSNEKILENIKKLGTLAQGSSDEAPRIVIRIPVVGSVNDDEENIRRTAEFVREYLPNAGMELLPYHEFGKIKYEALCIPYDNAGLGTPDKDQMERLKMLVTDEGIRLCDYR